MRKLALIFALLFAIPAHAGPLHWAKTHKRFLLMEGAGLVGAEIHREGLKHCRQHFGPEPCDEHYGEAWAAFWVTTAASVIIMPVVTEACWKNDGGKPCYVLGYTGPAFQTIWGIHERTIHEKDTGSKPDLSSVVLVRK